MADLDLNPESCAQALARWDDDLPVMSVALGEVGPSYEQQCQIMAFECVRVLLDRELPEWEDTKGNEQARQFLTDRCVVAAAAWGFEPTQMQVTLSVNHASVMIRNGWRTAVRKAEPQRRITVCRRFP